MKKTFLKEVSIDTLLARRDSVALGPRDGKPWPRKPKVKTLTYWIRKVKGDHPCYSIRALLKKDCVIPEGNDPKGYHPIKKVTATYVSAFDLLEQCLSGENYADWER